MNEEEQEKEWVNFNMRLRPAIADLLDEQAEKIGISRAALINVIVAQHFDLI